MKIQLSNPIIFKHRCDASAGIALSQDTWAGANDEENTLRVYSTNGGIPLNDSLLSLDHFLLISSEPDKSEADLESATRIGDVIWWIGSHSQSKKGNDRPNRHRLFATRVTSGETTSGLQPIGKPCSSLRGVMIADPRHKDFDLSSAAKIPPKAEGGFNIESICADATEKLLWVGLRNPIPKDGALLIPVADLDSLVQGAKPVLLDPVQLDLGGLGFRDMIYGGGNYLILAGDHRDRADAEAQPPRLFTWGGLGTNPEPLLVDFGTFNPEALILFPDRQVLVISDDGTQLCGGVQCKEASIDEQQFRGAWLTGFWPFT